MDKRPKTKLAVSMGGYSTAGNREINQDAFALKDPYSDSDKSIKGIVACVADGVSCSDNGQQASQISVTQFISDYLSTNKNWDVKQSASKVLSSLNTWLYRHNQDDLRHNGLITTFSSVILKSTTAHLIHIGDSRIYRYREQALTQLSNDHSRTTHTKNSILTRALGMDCHLDIDYQTVSLQVGDLFMLTSDGVHDYLDKTEISKHLSTLTDKATTQNYEQVAKGICDQALAQGSDDNSSCLIVKINTLPKADLSELFSHLSTLVIPPALQVGNEIDCFSIDKILHEGTRSHVYLATDKSNQSKVVLKMPSLNFEGDLNYLLGFYKEQWVGQSIDNPSIMSIANNIKNSVFLYHICEYVEGISLRQWMHENPYPELKQVNTIINKVVNAVRVLQRAGMVHRDLKPENIMLTPDGNIKILDFGTVRVNGFEEIVKEQQEEPLGAVGYIAPEYLNDGESSVLSDLFSIAVITYEMLAGQLPYPDNQAQSLDKARQYTWKYSPIQPLRPEMSSRLERVLRKALNEKPSQRYSSMSEFIGDLAKVQQRQIAKVSKKSLLERDPVKFWQWLAFIFMGISATQLLIMLRDSF